MKLKESYKDHKQKRLIAPFVFSVCQACAIERSLFFYLSVYLSVLSVCLSVFLFFALDQDYHSDESEWYDTYY